MIRKLFFFVGICTFFMVLVVGMLLRSRGDVWVHPGIQGVVKGAQKSDRGIEGVTVQIVNSEYTDKSTTTDSEGKFRLDAVLAREFSFPGDALKKTDLLLTVDGYAKKKVRLNLTSSELSGHNRAPLRTLEVVLDPLAEDESADLTRGRR